jgi:hypothetical protein
LKDQQNLAQFKSTLKSIYCSTVGRALSTIRSDFPDSGGGSAVFSRR